MDANGSSGSSGQHGGTTPVWQHARALRKLVPLELADPRPNHMPEREGVTKKREFCRKAEQKEEKGNLER